MRPLVAMTTWLAALALLAPLTACGSRKERCERIVARAWRDNIPADLNALRAIIEQGLTQGGGHELNRPPLPDGDAGRAELVTRCIATRASEICLDCLDTSGHPASCDTCKPR